MRRPTKACPFCETPRPLRRLQGRAHARPLHHRSRQDPAEPPERRVRAAPASAEHRDQARALPGAAPVHAGPAGLTWKTLAAPAPSERGWGKLLLALAAFLFIPAVHAAARAAAGGGHAPPARSPRSPRAVSWGGGRAGGCCWPSSGSGSRLWMLAAARAGRAVLQPRARLEPAPRRIVRARLPVREPRVRSSRARCRAVSLALTLVLLMSSRGPLTPSRARLAVQAEFARRNTETLAIFRGRAQGASRGGEVDAAGRDRFPTRWRRS